MTRWQLQEAKARLSELVQSARKGPQEITVRGKPAAVVVSTEEFDRLRQVKRGKGGFLDFIRKSPLAGAELEVKRDRRPSRPAPDLA
jgi:prevent-host-death family protein